MADGVKRHGLAVRLPFATPEAFLQGYGTLVTRGGIYLRTRSLFPPGTPVILEVKLEDGSRILYANAIVAFVTGTSTPGGVSGMGFKFITLDRASRRFLDSVAAAMPHARSTQPPVPKAVGPIDTRPEAVLAPTPPPSQVQAALPSIAAGQLTVSAPDASGITAPMFVPSQSLPKTGPIIGIDLGTSNSSAAIVRNGKPVMLRDEHGRALIPSMVALTSRGKLVVGEEAKAQMITNPRWTVAGFKRLLGRPWDSPDVLEVMRRFAWEVVKTDLGECAVQLADRIYRLEEMSALVLREVKRIAEAALKVPVNRAVITVPAWYSDRQRHAVREAAALTGLHVERIVNEPTAAALAYGHGRKLSQRVLVYDLGGGTFDASVLELNDTVYEVIATGGDNFLGGIDFDNAIVTWLMEDFTAKHGTAFSDRVALQRVADAAEKAKIALSSVTESKINVPFVTMIKGQPVDLALTMTRRKLVELTRVLVDQTMATCQEILAVKPIRADEIDAILLVGGQAKAPLVQERITVLFGRKPTFGADPEEAVALGAALLAHSIETQSGILLIDVLPMTIGIGIPGGHIVPLLARHTPLPATKKHRLVTTRDNQEELEVQIFQGEGTRAVENTFLGIFTVRDLPRKPRGGVAIEVTFELNNEGLLTISGRDELTGKIVQSKFVTKHTPESVRERLSDLADDQFQDQLESLGATGIRGMLRSLFE